MTPSGFDALSEAEQAEMVAYIQWKGSLCADCGMDAEKAADPHNTFLLEDTVCWSCRIVADKHAEVEKAAEKNPSANHGRKLFVSGVRVNPKLKVVSDDG